MKKTKKNSKETSLNRIISSDWQEKVLRNKFQKTQISYLMQNIKFFERENAK